jgi:hypothetical protein
VATFPANHLFVFDVRFELVCVSVCERRRRERLAPSSFVIEEMLLSRNGDVLQILFWCYSLHCSVRNDVDNASNAVSAFSIVS